MFIVRLCVDEGALQFLSFFIDGWGGRLPRVVERCSALSDVEDVIFHIERECKRLPSRSRPECGFIDGCTDVIECGIDGHLVGFFQQCRRSDCQDESDDDQDNEDFDECEVVAVSSRHGSRLKTGLFSIACGAIGTRPLWCSFRTVSLGCVSLLKSYSSSPKHERSALKSSPPCCLSAPYEMMSNPMSPPTE